MDISFSGSELTVCCPGFLDIAKTFTCGQCFRFDACGENGFTGIINGKRYSFSQQGDRVTVNAGSSGECDELCDFLSLDTDYSAVNEDILSRLDESDVMHFAIKCGAGIRILRQDPWETLVSFIISQNNNIPRIKKIIAALCRAYGEPAVGGGFSFPSADVLSQVGVSELRALGCGFRDRYISAAATAVASGRCDLRAIAGMPTQEGFRELERIDGVGPKVAACVSLFGLNRLDAFPVDVWVKRVVAKYYDGSFSSEMFGPFAGIAQQYLFFYERSLASQTSLS